MDSSNSKNTSARILNNKNIKNISKKLIQLEKYKVLATGITSAYEIADNQLREFVITNRICRDILNEGYDFELLLINDTNDPFTLRHYNNLLKFDKELGSFKKYVGHPISRIPSPYNTHESLAYFFQELLTEN
jgi:lysyl-tRNA synthetase class I